jgi:hypothetical protein
MGEGLTHLLRRLGRRHSLGREEEAKRKEDRKEGERKPSQHDPSPARRVHLNRTLRASLPEGICIELGIGRFVR